MIFCNTWCQVYAKTKSWGRFRAVRAENRPHAFHSIPSPSLPSQCMLLVAQVYFLWDSTPQLRGWLSVTHTFLSSPNDCAELLQCFVLALQLPSLCTLRFSPAHLPAEERQKHEAIKSRRKKGWKDSKRWVCQEKTHVVLLFQLGMFRTWNYYQEFCSAKKGEWRKTNTVRCVRVKS